MPKESELRDERITLRVTPSFRAAVEREAERQMRSVADVIILAVSEAIGLRKPARARKARKER